jgi:hypothetical protein
MRSCAALPDIAVQATITRRVDEAVSMSVAENV